MAKEIKSFTVDPSKEEETINSWLIWGWELKSTQEVKTQEAQKFTGQNYDKTISYYETTKGDHYVKLTFERDKSMPNYAELCELEEWYNTSQPPTMSNEPDRPSKPSVPIMADIGFIGGIGIFFVCGAVIGWLINKMVEVGIVLIVGIVIVAIGYGIQRPAYNKELAAWKDAHNNWEKEHDDWEKRYKKECDEYDKKRRETIERAKSLVG